MSPYHTYYRVILKGESAINRNGPMKYISIYIYIVVGFEGGNRQLGAQVSVCEPMSFSVKYIYISV